VCDFHGQLGKSVEQLFGPSQKLFFWRAPVGMPAYFLCSNKKKTENL